MLSRCQKSLVCGAINRPGLADVERCCLDLVGLGIMARLTETLLEPWLHRVTFLTLIAHTNKLIHEMPLGTTQLFLPLSLKNTILPVTVCTHGNCKQLLYINAIPVCVEPYIQANFYLRKSRGVQFARFPPWFAREQGLHRYQPLKRKGTGYMEVSGRVGLGPCTLLQCVFYIPRGLRLINSYSPCWALFLTALSNELNSCRLFIKE